VSEEEEWEAEEPEEKEPKFFCPSCGAPDEELTYHCYHDKLIRRDVANVFISMNLTATGIPCNKCGKAFLIIKIEEKEEEW